MDKKKMGRRRASAADLSNEGAPNSYGKSMAEAFARRNEMLREQQEQERNQIPSRMSSSVGFDTTISRRSSGFVAERDGTFSRKASALSTRKASIISVGSIARTRTPVSKGNKTLDFLEMLDVRSYEAIQPQYGLTIEELMIYHACGLKTESIKKLKEAFTTLDKDGGGELGAVEIFEALDMFGQRVTDEDVRRTISELDSDGNGMVAFKEFLLLAIPGMLNPETTEVRKMKHTAFQDRYSYGISQQIKIEIPEQCFADYLQPQASSGETSLAQETPKYVDFRINFKLPSSELCSRSESANAGSISCQLEMVTNQWTEKIYYYTDIIHLEKHIIQFNLDLSISAPPPPIPKCRFVRYPKAADSSLVQNSSSNSEGFDIESVEHHVLTVNCKGSEKMAIFASPPASIQVVCSGHGSRLEECKKYIAMQCNKPPWVPLRMSFRCSPLRGSPRKDVELREDFGELESIGDDNVIINVHSESSKKELESVIAYLSSKIPWIQDFYVKTKHPASFLLSQLALQGASASLLPKVLTVAECDLGICFTDQLVAESRKKNLGWLSSAPHPNILPLFLLEENMILCPFATGISGEQLPPILRESLLGKTQLRVIHTMVGMQMAMALDHMHSEGLLHLDMKPANLLVHLGKMNSENVRMWQELKVLVCDFGNCCAHRLSNPKKRGTPGFWSPEQVCFADIRLPQTEGPSSFWGGESALDPPPLCDATLSDKCDSWGWATTMLAILGKLNEMKKLGYSHMIKNLEEEGRHLNLTKMFLYEQQPYIDSLQQELDSLQKEYNQYDSAEKNLRDEVERQKATIDPLWNKAITLLRGLDPKDLEQFSAYRRPPPMVRLVSSCVAAILELPKNLTEWEKLKKELSQQDAISSIIEFDRDKGSSMQATRQLALLTRTEPLDPDKITEKHVPNADPAGKGSALKACVAYAAAVVAVQSVNALRKSIGPIQMEAKVNENAMERLSPRIESLQQNLKEEKSKLQTLTEITGQKVGEIIQIVLDCTRTDALGKLKTLLEMENVLTEQQYDCLAREVGYCTGEHALVFRRLCGFTLKTETLDMNTQPALGEPRLLDRYNFLSSSHPHRDAHISDVNSLFADIDIENLVSPSKALPNQVPLQKDRYLCYKNLRNLSPVGDPLKLLLAWCLQTNPVDRISVRGITMLMSQLAPGQEWKNQGGLPGMSQSATRLSLDKEFSTMRTKESAFPAVLELLSPSLHHSYQKLLLVERTAKTLLRKEEHISARNVYMDCILQLSTSGSDTVLDEEILRLLFRICLSLCKIGRSLRCFDFAHTWISRSILVFAALHDVLRGDNVDEDDVEQKNRLDISLWATIKIDESLENKAQIKISEMAAFWSPVLALSKASKLDDRIIFLGSIYADVLAEKGCLLDAQIVDSKGNVCYTAAEEYLLLATRLVFVTSGHSVQLAEILHHHGRLQAHLGYFTESIATLGISLEVAAHATGYDAYLGHKMTAPLLESLAESQMRVGKYDSCIGNLLRAKHIYEATDFENTAGFAISGILLSLSKAEYCCENYGKALSNLHEALEICSLESKKSSCSPRLLAFLYSRQASILLDLRRIPEAVVNFRTAIDGFQGCLRVANYSKDQMDDHSRYPVAECWVGLAACYEQEGKHWEALECLQKAFKLYCETPLPNHHPLLCEIRGLMSKAYNQLGKLGNSLEWMISCVAFQETVQGKYHPDTADSYLYLSNLHLASKQFNKSQNFAELAMKAFVIALGEQHPRVSDAIVALVSSSVPIALRKLKKRLESQGRTKGTAANAQGYLQECSSRFRQAREGLVSVKKRLPIIGTDVAMAEELCEKCQTEASKAQETSESASKSYTKANKEVGDAEGEAAGTISLLDDAKNILSALKPTPRNVQALQGLDNLQSKLQSFLQILVAGGSLNVEAADDNRMGDEMADS